MSGHIIITGINEQKADTWKLNSSISVELKNAVFYDYPKYIINCVASTGDVESCTCEGENGDKFTCDPQKLYDETQMQTFTYNQKFNLIPCETLTNVPELDPKCE